MSRSRAHPATVVCATIFGAMLSGGLTAQPLRAQATADDPPPSAEAVAAADSVRALFLRGDDTTALAVASSALARGLGTTELQSWRLAALSRHPASGTTPMRTARRMASMFPQSPWTWMALALTASAVPDSGSVVREAARKSLLLAPSDTVVRAMVADALRRAGFASTADSVVQTK